LIASCVGGLTTGAWGRRRAKANAARMEATPRLEEDHAPALS
jgi:hypothetical protein